MDFNWTDEQAALRARIVAFATEQLGDPVGPRDRDARFDRELWTRCAAAGVQGLPFPEEYGGRGRDALDAAIALEALGFACRDNGLVFALGAQLWSVQMPIARFGSPAQNERFLAPLCHGEWIGAHAMSEPEAGSDAFSIRTTARRVDGGYRLDGAKTFVSQATVADLFLVYARLGSGDGPLGISPFLIERSAPGLGIGSGIEKMGLRTSPMAKLELDGCVVPESGLLGREGFGARIFLDAIEWERAGIMAGAVGAMDRLLADSLDYAQRRRQFGRPIAAHGPVAHRLVDMKVRLEAARLVLYRAVRAKEQESDAATASAVAKLFISEAYRQTALDAMDIHGGYGYTAETGIERDVRDALGSSIYSGTSDIQRLVIARGLGLRPDGSVQSARDVGESASR